MNKFIVNIQSAFTNFRFILLFMAFLISAFGVGNTEGSEENLQIDHIDFADSSSEESEEDLHHIVRHKIGYSRRTLIDFDDSSSSVQIPADKYEEAMEICRSHSNERPSHHEFTYNPLENYADAIRICGVDAYRLPFPIIWKKYVTTFFSNNITDLIEIELHHIAGDMIHIAELAKGEDYFSKIKSTLNNKFMEEWWNRQNISEYSTTAQLEELARTAPGLPQNEWCNEKEMCEVFIKMIGFFKDWDEVQKQSAPDLRTFYSKIKLDAYYREDYLALIKYRNQRKLKNTWSFRDTPVYRRAVVKNIKKHNLQQRMLEQKISNGAYVARLAQTSAQPYTGHTDCRRPFGCSSGDPRNCPAVGMHSDCMRPFGCSRGDPWNCPAVGLH